MNKKTYRNYSAELKVKLLRSHLIDKKAVSDICEENSLKPSLFYKWQNDLFRLGSLVFETTNPNKVHAQYKKQIERLESKLTKKNEVLAELMQDYVALKKEFGEE